MDTTMEDPTPTPFPANGTESASPSGTQYHFFIQTVFILVVAVVGTIGNAFTAAALLLNRTLRQNPSTAFMVNLLLCLVVINAVGFPWFGTTLLLKETLSKRVTTASHVFIAFLAQVHQHTICAVAINRTIGMMHPFVHKRLMQPRWVAVCLASIWLSSAVVWMAVFMVEPDQQQLLKRFYYIYAIIVFGLPLLVTSGCYITMWIKVRLSMRRKRRSKQDNNAEAVQENDPVRQWRNHVTRTTLVIFLVFLICNVPHYLMLMFQSRKRLSAAWTIVRILYGLQFCVDPVVYTTVSLPYRKACVDLLRRMFRCEAELPH